MLVMIHVDNFSNGTNKLIGFFPSSWTMFQSHAAIMNPVRYLFSFIMLIRELTRHATTNISLFDVKGWV